MRFSPKLAPNKVAVMPLMKKSVLDEPARRIFNDLQREYKCEYDVAGSIGKRYRRQDEIGTPYCITFDYDSLEDNTVTLRDRDTMVQERIGIDQLKKCLKDKLCL